MPELPEVETTGRGIRPHLVNTRIQRVLVRDSRLRWPVPDDFVQNVTGRLIETVDRRAKYLFLRTNAGAVMIHLGMSGSLRIVDGDTEPRKHDHVDFELDTGQTLRFHDPRRFGSIFWVVNDEHPLLEKLGPEPLSDDFTGQYLFEKSRGRKTAVKQFLMNGHIVVGVGNIYANEALFDAGIRPDREAGRVSKARFEALADAVKVVLANAIEAGGTTLRDFVNESGNPGYFKQSLHVYGRGGEPCLQCEKVLKEVRLGARTTVFCTRCQK